MVAVILVEDYGSLGCQGRDLRLVELIIFPVLGETCHSLPPLCRTRWRWSEVRMRSIVELVIVAIEVLLVLLGMEVIMWIRRLLRVLSEVVVLLLLIVVRSLLSMALHGMFMVIGIVLLWLSLRLWISPLLLLMLLSIA